MILMRSQELKKWVLTNGKEWSISYETGAKNIFSERNLDNAVREGHEKNCLAR